MNPKPYLSLLHAAALLLAASSATATPFYFSTGDPDGKMAMASRPASGSTIGIESADDFALSQETKITSASFTGLLTGGATAPDINYLGIEIYRVFPNDSSVAGTSGPPTFSTSLVPTRVNSPSDVAFDSRDATGGTLSFSINTLGTSFTTLNSIQPGGINPIPNQTTGGNGPVTGSEVQFDVSFLSALDLPADHYFFVPLVGLADPASEFYWLSAPKPIVAPGTPFLPDLQAWIRDDNLDPDWLRVGTDIVGGAPAPTFNAAFSLTGETVPGGSGSGSVPEPDSLFLVAVGGLALLAARQPQPGKHDRIA